MNRKRINLTLNEEQFNLIQQEAEKEKLSPPSYVVKLLMSSLNNTELDNKERTIENTDINKKTVTIRLTEKDAQVLHEKAAELGLPDIGYIRHLIHTKDFVFHDVSTDDLYEYIEQIGGVIRDISSFVGSIKKYGQTKIYPQEIRKMEEYIEKLTLLMRNQVQLTMSTRERAYNTLIDKRTRKPKIPKAEERKE